MLGITITVFQGSLLSISSAFLLTGNHLDWFHIPLAIIVTSLFCWWSIGHYFPQSRWRILGLTGVYTAGAFVAFAILTGLLYDTSWDGQNYHTEAILQLARGWNPFYDAPANVTYPHLLSFFAKGPWISAADLYALTGNFEQGKVFHLVLMLAAFWLCLAAFSTFRELKHPWVLILSALMAFNPVSLYQMFTFYVDGLLSSLLVITVCLMILHYRYPSRVLMVTLASAMVIMANVKLSGAVYGAFIGGSYGLWYFLRRKPHRVELAIWLLAGCLVAVLVVGYNPYITQYVSGFLSNGNPFYPSDWKTLISLEHNTPINFLSMTWGEKFLTSLLSSSQATNALSQCKWPFTASLDEIRAFYAPDVRVAGFGPLFGGAALITVGMMAAAVAKYRQRIAFATPLLFLLAVVLASTVAMSEAWWARYIPQLWMVPILTAALVMSAATHGKLHRLSRLLVVILCVNQLLIGLPSAINAIVQSSLLTQQLGQLRNTETRITADFNYFVSTEFRFEQWGIAYESVDELTCEASQQMQIIATETRVCLP